MVVNTHRRRNGRFAGLFRLNRSNFNKEATFFEDRPLKERIPIAQNKYLRWLFTPFTYEYSQGCPIHIQIDNKSAQHSPFSARCWPVPTIKYLNSVINFHPAQVNDWWQCWNAKVYGSFFTMLKYSRVKLRIFISQSLLIVKSTRLARSANTYTHNLRWKQTIFQKKNM